MNDIGSSSVRLVSVEKVADGSPSSAVAALLFNPTRVSPLSNKDSREGSQIDGL
jgi:hypothetical protein